MGNFIFYYLSDIKGEMAGIMGSIHENMSINNVIHSSIGCNWKKEELFVVSNNERKKNISKIGIKISDEVKEAMAMDNV